MIHGSFIRVFTSFILLGLVFVPHTNASPVIGVDDSATIWVHSDSEQFIPVTEEHRAAWERVIEACLPLNTHTALSARCMSALGEYFPNEPVWSYNYLSIYDWTGSDWPGLDELRQRRFYTPADFLNNDFPYWRDIFDDQIEQRQELFLRVVSDFACQEIASILPKKYGMHAELAEQCAAREMYQYAAYLSACFDATQRLTKLQEIVTKPPNPVDRALNLFEVNFQKLDENEADKALRAAAKHHMEKIYLHASWVASHCHEHGLVLRSGVTTQAYTSPSGQTFDSYTTTHEKLPWLGLKGKNALALLTDTHEFIMKIAMKSGDNWAIRSGLLDSTIVGDLGEDLMQSHPLLMYRMMCLDGNLGPSVFRLTDERTHRYCAKAYLLLVEAAGEEFARREYNPERLAEQIQYIEDGGSLYTSYTLAVLREKLTIKIQLQLENEKPRNPSETRSNKTP